MDLEKMTIEELTELINEAEFIRDTKREREKATLWQEALEAIDKYLAYAKDSIMIFADGQDYIYSPEQTKAWYETHDNFSGAFFAKPAN